MDFLQDVDMLIGIAYLLVCLIIGLYKAKGVKSLKQFAIGSGNAKAPLLTAVIFATITGAGSTIGTVKEMYFLGAVFIIGQLIQPLYWLVSARIFANNIEQFQGCLTVSHIMHKLYGNSGRWATSLLSLFISAGIIAAQAIAIGHVFHYFFKISIPYGILLSYGVLTLYSALGGIRSVVFTEVFQFAVFFIIIPISCAFYFYNVGSIEGVTASLSESYSQIKLGSTNILTFLGLLLYALIPDSSGPNVQRYLMASSSAELKKSFIFIAVISIPFTLVLCFIAYLVKSTASHINPSEVMFYFTDQLPVGLKGFMIAGLFAIIMSTAESWVNSAAVIAVNDIVKPLFPHLNNNKQLAWVRVFTILVSFVSLSLAFTGKGILELIWLFHNLWDPIILIPLSTGFLGLKTNSKTFLANIITALVFCMLGRFIAGEFGVVSLAFGLVGSAFGFFGMHCWQVRTGTLNKPLPNLTIKFPKLKNPFTNFSGKIRNFRKRVWHEKPRYAVFGGFTLYYYFFFCAFLRENPTRFVVLTMLSAGFILTGLLLMRDVFFSQRFQKKYVPFYWYFLVTYCLPFIGSYSLLASNGSSVWVITGLMLTLAVFYFMNAISSLVIISIGTVSGYIMFAVTHSYLGITLNTSPFLVPYVCLLALVITVLFLRHQEKMQHEKIESMQAMAGTIAHEVKNPMAAMAMVMETFNSIMSDAILNAKKKGVDFHLIINEQDYEMLLSLKESIQKLTHKGVFTVDSLLLLLRTSLEDCQKDEIHIKDLIEQAQDDYEMHQSAVRKIKVNIEDNFKITCNITYMKHVIFNLLKNSYKYNGSRIRIEITAKNNTLYFTDYGIGIEKGIMAYIFERFFTKNTGGTGLGLSFCKMVLESMGGTITCKSKVGEYTTFKLTFPKKTDSQV